MKDETTEDTLPFCQFLSGTVAILSNVFIKTAMVTLNSFTFYDIGQFLLVWFLVEKTLIKIFF